MEIVKEKRICLPQLQVLGNIVGCEGQRVEVQAQEVQEGGSAWHPCF